MPEQKLDLPALPKSLDGHTVARERYELIGPHIALLSTTALAVSNTLPLQADVTDHVRVLEAEGR